MASENKDMMAKHASWSEGILGDKAAPSAVAYSWIDRNVPVSGRTHMLLADLTASVHARNPGLSVQQAVLAAAKDMVQKGVATGDIRTFVEQGGRFSRPGEKDMMATRKPKVREKWETVFYEYFHGVPVSIMDSGKIKNDINAILASGADLKVEMPKLVKKYGRFSRPGAKAKFKVEDGFYFGKGRKERFVDDAKQIAQTILAQLGGGRFVAMTGAKNLAFYNNPPGLRMSIGRGAKDAIKYLRVDYDRGSDTYTMIFSNKSGSTVKSVNHVYADSLQRVFTSTTGFDTHL
jgi:hypothetical protein